jgi:CBS domain containing-hemolysin-like protein
MVPWRKVITIRQDADAAAIWALANRSGRSRFPVLDTKGQVAGVLDIDDALMLEQATCPPADKLMSPAKRFTTDQPWRDALRRMQHEHISLAIVEDAAQRAVGIVTIKDMVEPVTGELWNW